MTEPGDRAPSLLIGGMCLIWFAAPSGCLLGSMARSMRGVGSILAVLAVVAGLVLLVAACWQYRKRGRAPFLCSLGLLVAHLGAAYMVLATTAILYELSYGTW